MTRAALLLRAIAIAAFSSALLFVFIAAMADSVPSRLVGALVAVMFAAIGGGAVGCAAARAPSLFEAARGERREP